MCIVFNEGNLVFIVVCEKVYELCFIFEWCGLGEIDVSGLCICDWYKVFDVEVKFNIGYGCNILFIEE